ncbi:Protein spaetzle [Halotydeus destructor]|nr:Protein spaetzle [Halotydeus destructor]
MAHVFGIIICALVLCLYSSNGHPVEQQSVRDDRVGDGQVPIIYDETPSADASSIAEQSNKSQQFIYPESSDGQTSANYVSKQLERNVDFPDDVEKTSLPLEMTTQRDEALTGANESEPCTTTVDQDGAIQYAPHVDNITSTTSRPFREPENLLLPSMDSTGKPECLRSPTDTYCETVPNYPKMELKTDIHLSPSEFRELFGVKEIDGRKMYQDEASAEERVCRPIPKLIYPQMARNQAKQWLYIVNDVEYTQAVVSEVCEKENKPCAYLDHNLPPGMYSRCRQKYAYRRLLAIHPTEKRTYTDTFQFPSCCACYVKSPVFGRSKEE